jgi:hypothetical protein
MQAKLLRGKVLPTMRLTFRFFFHGLTICRLTSGNNNSEINDIGGTGMGRGPSIRACQRQSNAPTDVTSNPTMSHSIQIYKKPSICRRSAQMLK